MSLTVKVQHEASGKWVRLPLPHQNDAAKSFRDLCAEVSRRFCELAGDGKFSLHLHPRQLRQAAPPAADLEAKKRDFFSSEDFQWSGTYAPVPTRWICRVVAGPNRTYSAQCILTCR